MAVTPTRLVVLVLAAGQGTRLRSKRIKLLHDVAGRPMAAHVLEAARALKPGRLITVVGFQAEAVQDALQDTGSEFVMQAEQRGTGHAVLQAAPLLQPEATLLILNGDLPTLRPDTLRKLISRHKASEAALTLVTAELPDATGYGRVVRDSKGRVLRIVEHRDATPVERALREINCGIYCTTAAKLLPVLRKLKPDNAVGEYYLTDAVSALLARGEKVAAYVHDDPQEVLGVNTRAELARAARTLWARMAETLMEEGVTLLDPARTWVDPRARVGRDTVIWPDVVIEGRSVIGEDCEIRPGARLCDVTLGQGVRVLDQCVVEESRLADGAVVGPFAYLRHGTVVEERAKVGTFVETKKTRLGRGSKAPHLSYLGDAEIGPDCNIGAGTITCNYDGVDKHPTVIEAGVFVGSDTQLVAPVRVGAGAYVAAGSTVTDDVPPGALAISRTPQANVEGWVDRKRRKSARKRVRAAGRR